MIFYLLFVTHIHLVYTPPPLYPPISLGKNIYLTLNPLDCHTPPPEVKRRVQKIKELKDRFKDIFPAGGDIQINYIYGT